ncbi:ComEA family DNA-binding protein [Undibacterium umbellatum]|uniref:Helix-hairpin-helix domain-containing protein n=1 Tax=Undibacterium umbellatum TaxID=2762300 RepID=A0ABR6Z6L0_9BURK|nr:helix-hairpin-helix domain-containing protein [Undibacterium umbellatum]MBC3907413.1 helix-hairpin-helix domain-containing protein [Undibacterium umbellatum]
MLKKLVFGLMALLAATGFAFADVDVNKGDQAALDGIKGIGPTKSKAIIEERTKNGAFKDWADFESRVKGIGEKSSAKLSAAGLTVNGQAKPGAAAKPVASAASAKADKAEKAADKAADKAAAPAAASAPAATAKPASAPAAAKAPVAASAAAAASKASAK